MSIFVNPNNNNFNEAIHSKIYVDKTDLIDYLNSCVSTTSKFICNSRPRRFGKSMTADMLCAYYSRGCDSREMFKPYKISSCPSFETYLNKQDVIRLDVQACIKLANGVENVVHYMEHACMDELQEVYPKIDISKQVSLLGTLNQIYNETKTQFVIIIDEWDVLFRDCKDTKIQNEYLDFLRSLFKSPYSNEFIALAYLTGILPIKRTMTQSALNNFREYTMVSPKTMASYIGFTELEVKALCLKYDVEFEKVKKWYDGYFLKNEHVYNPTSVVNVLEYNEFQSYWTQTSSYESIDSLIQMNFDGLKEAIIDMLGGNKVEVNTNSFQNDMESFRDKDDVLTALIYLGYLAYDSTWNSVFIPNEEIRQEFVIALKENKWNELIEFEKESDTIFEATLEMDSKTVALGIERIHNRFSSNFTYHNENALSNILTLAYLSTLKYYFKPQRELPSDRGFADFVYIPKPQYKEYYPALVVELKWNQSVESAMDQIHAKKYFESIEDYTDNLLLVGINYDKKTKVHTCKIEHA